MTACMTATPSSSVYNVPNLLTSIRLLLAVAVMGLIPIGYHMTAMIIFIIAVTTDWMDGYWARKYGQVTKLGRIFDPFVDKIIICGTFIALVGVPASGVAAWMAIVVVARELLVTSLRGIIEGSGGDFSASSIGKWKMVLQCVAVVAVMLTLISETPSRPLELLTQAFLWSAVALTVYSGYVYTLVAAKVMSSEGAPTKDTS